MDFTPIPFEDDAPDTAMAAGFEPDAASVARTAVTGSGAESALATLQRTIQQYILTKEQDEAALRETRQETDRIRARIVELQRSKQRGALGGRSAVAENDRMIAKHSELMERRLSKAKEGRMLAIANVTRLRAAVDRLRRERVTVLAQCSSIREDMTKVAAEGLAVQNAIAALIAQCDEVEAQTDGTYEENKIQISEWLADKPSAGTRARVASAPPW
ncbi:hypothetical protein EON68_01020 [archaeon]|nr:MAG: hypothetical protein EON68_01020 [archaeon]